MELETLIIANDPVVSEEIKSMVQNESSLKLVDTVAQNQALMSAAKYKPRIAWIDIDPSPVQGLSVIAELMERYPGITIWASSKEEDSEVVRTAFRLGISNFFSHDTWLNKFEAAAQRAIEKHQNDFQSNQRGQKKEPLITILVSESQSIVRLVEPLLSKNNKITLIGTFSFKEAKEQCYKSQPDLVVIDISKDPVSDLLYMDKVKEMSPESAIFIVNDTLDPSLVKDSFRLGAIDYLDNERIKTDIGASIQSLLPEVQQEQKVSTLFVQFILVVLTIAFYLLFNLLS